MVDIPARRTRKPKRVELRFTATLSFFCPKCGIRNFVPDNAIPAYPSSDCQPIGGNCGPCGERVSLVFAGGDPFQPSRN